MNWNEGDDIMNFYTFKGKRFRKLNTFTLALLMFAGLLLVMCQTIYGKEVLRKTSPAMSLYYRYNSSYYALRNASDDIQKNISLHLYDNFYQIKGIDVSKSIALFDGRYYDRLDYAFSDSLEFGGKTYLIAANYGCEAGKLMGSVGKFDIYEQKDVDISEGICVHIGGDLYCPAYSYPSSLNFMDKSYQLRVEKYKIGDRAESYLGTADSYDIYQEKDMDSRNSILVHINDHEEVQADFKEAGSPKDEIPASIYGTPVESMYPTFSTMQWKLHGIYILAGYPTNSDDLKKKLGIKVGTDKIGGYSYELYSIKGDKTNKSIIVKNNKVYQLYNFWFKDTVVFKGHTYVFGEPNSKYKTIEKIGDVDNCQIYSIKGIAITKAVDVWVNVNVPDVGSLHSDFIANRVGK